MAVVALLPIAPARASGPVERLLQVMLTAKDPNVMVVRYGVPGGRSNGLLFSNDGGRTLRAACSSFIGKDLKLQRSQSPYLSTVFLDPSGTLSVYQDSDMFYSGDTSGCSITKVPGFEGKTVAAVAADPADPTGLYILSFERDANGIATTTLSRRDGQGKITAIGPVKRPAGMEQVLGTDLIATRAGNATRLVAMYSTWVGTEDSKFWVATSEDGGANWKEQAFPFVTEKSDGRLLAFDPTNPDRVVAVEYGDSVKDKLLISSDRGATFMPWAEIDQYSGITFGADGRVFISATGSEAGFTGAFTAAKVGDPLTRLPMSEGLDCIAYRGSDQKLFACKMHQLGTLDAATGVFTKITSLEEISRLVECDGVKVKDACEAEFNSGAAYCCTGHFPFAPFCGDYNVTAGGKLCGQAGRAYDCSIGRGPADCAQNGGTKDAGSSAQDAGAPTGARDAGLGGVDAGLRPSTDAAGGDDDDEPGAGGESDEGCSCRSAPSFSEGAMPLAFGLGLLLFTNRRARRRPRS